MLVPILALFIIPVGMAYADTTEEIGKNYNQIIDWETGIATWTSHPERIMINGEWENYSFTNNGNQVIFKSEAIGGLIYDKSSCSYSIYDTGFDGEQIIPSVSIQARSAINGTDTWTNMAVNNQSCDVNVIQNDKGIIITSTKLLQSSETLFSANGTQLSANPYDTERLSHELKLDVRSGIKETFRLYNIASDTKLGISQTVHTGNEIRIGDTVYDVASVNGQTFDKAWIIENEAEILGIADNLNYDFDIGIERLNAIRVIDDFGTSKVVMDYAASPGVENFIEIDPNYTLTVSSGGYVSNAGACSTSFSWWSGNNEEMFAGLAPANYCYRGVLEWDISSIPDTTSISDVSVVLTYTGTITSGGWHGANHDLMPVTSAKPSGLTLTTGHADVDSLAQDIGTGTPYVSNIAYSGLSIGTDYTYDLGSAADTDLQNQLSDDWFALGGVLNDETDTGGNFEYAKKTYSGVVRQLVVSYVVLPTVPLNLATTTGIPIELDWDAPADDGGSAITNYKVYRTTNQFALTDMPDSKGSDAQIDMAGNEILLHLDSADVGTASNIVIDWDGEAYSSTQTLAIDLGETLSDTQWKMRFTNTISTISATGGTGGNFLVIGIGDLDVSTDLETSTNPSAFIGVLFRDDHGAQSNDDIWAMDSDGTFNTITNGMDTQSTGIYATNLPAGTYNTEIERTSATAYTVKIYDSTWSSVVDTISGTTSASTDDLRYIKVDSTMPFTAGSAAYTGQITDLQVWDHNDDIVEPTALQTPVGSAHSFGTGNTLATFVVSDTSGNNYDASHVSGTIQSGIFDNEMLDPNLTFSGANIPDGTEAFTIGAWHKGASASDGYSTTVNAISDLYAYYSFEDTGSTLTDSVSSGLGDGTANGSPTTGTSGIVGNAWSLDGVDDNIDLPTSQSLTDFSVSVWVKDIQGDNGHILNGAGSSWITGAYLQHNDDSPSTTYGWRIGHGGGGQNDMNCASEGGTNCYVTDSDWHHVVFTQDTSNNGKIYVDGVLSISDTSSYQAGTSQFTIGSTASDSNFSEYEIDELALYTKVLSASEITSLATVPTPSTKFLGAGDITFNVDGTTANVKASGQPGASTISVTWDASTCVGCSVNGDTVTATATGWYTGIARATETISASVGGTLEFTSTSPNTQNAPGTNTYVGLGAGSLNNGAGGKVWHDIEYGFSDEDITENGGVVSPDTAFTRSDSDVLKIVMTSSGAVTYFINDSLVHTSTLTASGDYYPLFASYESGDTMSAPATVETTLGSVTISDSTAQDYFYTFTRNGNDFEIFQSGISKGTFTDSTSMGTTPTYEINLSGTLDEFFINDVQESDADILTMSNRGVAPTVINSPTDSEYDDSSVVGGTTYYYQTSAVNSVGESPKTAMVSGLAGTPPGNPTGVSTAIQNPDSAPLTVRVSWSTPSNVGSGTLSGFEIYRDGTLIQTTGLVNLYDAPVSTANTAYD